MGSWAWTPEARIGNSAFEQMKDKDLVIYIRLVALYHPKAVRDALEHAMIDAGLTNADLRAMREKALKVN
jgi:hypothetical protein